ncbi:hypothetical protein MY4038_005366 [Beauveria bassiana]
MQDPSPGRGGYCMELSIFFHHMLRGLGFWVTMTGVRNRTRTDGIPSREYQGWWCLGPCTITTRLTRPPCPRTHINNIVYLRDETKYSADAAFGGDGSTAPLCMNEAATVHDNLGSQQVRLVHDPVDKQERSEPRRGFTRGPVEFTKGAVTEEDSGDDCMAGKVMLVNDLVKVNLGGKTQAVCQLLSESERLAALRTYFIQP